MTEIEAVVHSVVEERLRAVEAALLKLQVEVMELNSKLQPPAVEETENVVDSDDGRDYYTSE